MADVFRQYGEAFLKRWGHTISPPQRKALRDIGACRTAALGGHIEQCDGCPHETIAYNSCRNRSCPKCQSTARDRWLAERAKELLPVPYCHVVFTLPDSGNRLPRSLPFRYCMSPPSYSQLALTRFTANSGKKSKIGPPRLPFARPGHGRHSVCYTNMGQTPRIHDSARRLVSLHVAHAGVLLAGSPTRHWRRV